MTEPLLVGSLGARSRARDGVEHAFADGRRQFEVVLAEDDQPQRQTDVGREDMGRRLAGVDDQPSLRGRLGGQGTEDLAGPGLVLRRSEEHTSELQSRFDLVCRLLLEKKKNKSRGKNVRPKSKR